jgi:hypothetical protein
MGLMLDKRDKIKLMMEGKTFTKNKMRLTFDGVGFYDWYNCEYVDINNLILDCFVLYKEPVKWSEELRVTSIPTDMEHLCASLDMGDNGTKKIKVTVEEVVD